MLYIKEASFAEVVTTFCGLYGILHSNEAKRAEMAGGQVYKVKIIAPNIHIDGRHEITWKKRKLKAKVLREAFSRVF